MHRVLVRQINGGRVLLDAGEVHHLVRVLRLGEHSAFEAFTGSGTNLHCLLRREGEEWYGQVVSTAESCRESPFHLALAQSMVKKDKFEWIVQKAVELGVVEIQPILSYRTEVRLTEDRRDRKLERWRKILAEAVKQSGRTVIPLLREPSPLEAALAGLRSTSRLAMDEAGPGNLRHWLRELARPAAVTVFIGPEGGWDDRDRIQFDRAGVARIRLGERILRSETAAITALAILQYELGDLTPGPPGNPATD